MLLDRHTKIIATLGPVSHGEDVIRQLLQAGANVLRLNFSHIDHNKAREVIAHIRALESELNYPIGILADLQGPKIRLGVMAAPVCLEEGALFVLDADSTPGTAERAHLPHPEILRVLKVGDKIYINDGLVRLEVVQAHAERMVCKVVAGGTVSSKKGVNLPGVDLPISAMTAKDKEDALFAAQAGADWIALSFVQRAEDITELRALVGNAPRLMAKMEMPNAVSRMEEILQVADAIMVARGDLGVEVPLEDVPSIQKKLIRKAREAGKPVVVATQMLESMITNASPTRAEVSDVANATFEGADALMLSAETASGQHPVAAVSMMASVIRRVERSSAWRPLMEARISDSPTDLRDAITAAADDVARISNACAIVSFTETGSTALRMARRRPEAPVLVLTPHTARARQVSLLWGCLGVVCPTPSNTDHLVELAVNAVKKAGIGKKDDAVVITAGIPFGQTGSTNMVRVATL